jgi:hypothetical protein
MDTRSFATYILFVSLLAALIVFLVTYAANVLSALTVDALKKRIGQVA